MNCINYVIQQGDTLYSLSRLFNVPLDLIMNANPYINVYNLQVDEVICIPLIGFEETNYTTYVMEDEDQLRSLLDMYGITLEEFLEFNDISSFEPGMNIMAPIMERIGNTMGY